MSTTDQKINAFFNVIKKDISVDEFLKFVSTKSHLATLHTIVEMYDKLYNLPSLIAKLTNKQMLDLCKIRKNFFDDYCKIIIYRVLYTSEEFIHKQAMINEKVTVFLKEYPGSIVSCSGTRTVHWLSHCRFTRSEFIRHLYFALEQDPSILLKFNKTRNYADLSIVNAAVALACYKVTRNIEYKNIVYSYLNNQEQTTSVKNKLIDMISSENDSTKFVIIDIFRYYDGSLRNNPLNGYIKTFSDPDTIIKLSDDGYQLDGVTLADDIFNNKVVRDKLAEIGAEHTVILPYKVQYANCVYRLHAGAEPTWLLNECPTRKNIRISTYLCLTNNYNTTLSLPEYKAILAIEDEYKLFRYTPRCYNKFIEILGNKMQESDILEYLYYKLKEE